jgi:hypothetical protein
MAVKSDALAASRVAPRVVSAAAGRAPTRARFGLGTDAANPTGSAVYVMPFATTLYNDGDVTLDADGILTVRTTGLYRVSIAGSWQDRADGQVDLRIVGLGHGDAAHRPGPYVPGKLTKVTGLRNQMGQYDVAATNVPRTSRYQGAWKPGTVGPGQIVSVDVRVARAGVVTVGDIAFASHTGITDAHMVRKASEALIVSAKVVRADVVRVAIWNPSPSTGIPIPPGRLQVVAMSAVATSGSSGAARMVMSSAIEKLVAGDCVYGYFRSKVVADLLRASDSTWLHVERWN